MRKNFLSNEDGGVVLWVGLIFGMLGVAAIVIDLSMLYVAKRRAQIVSDVAVVSAAAAQGTINTSNPVASPQAIATANSVAEINGYSSSSVKTIAAPSPRGDNSFALKTDITDDVKLGFGIYSLNGRGSVDASSWAKPNDGGAAGLCSGSLAGPVNIYGNAVVDGPTCTVRAATYFYSCGKADISLAKVQVGYKSAAEKPYLCSTASLQTTQPFDYSVAPPSPLLNNPFELDARLVTLKTTLQRMANGWPFPTTSSINPKTPGGADQSSPGTLASGDTLPKGDYGSLTVASSNITLAGSGGPDPSCTSPTTFSAGWTFNGGSSPNKVTVNSGCYVVRGTFKASSGSNNTINIVPGASVVFVFDAGFNANSDSNTSFVDDGTGNTTSVFNGGTITVATSASLTFGNGPFWLYGGSMNAAASSSKITFGNGPFYFYGGTIYNSGMMTYGNGPFYFQGGSLTLYTSSMTSFGIGDVWFYGGSAGTALNGSVFFGRGGDPANANGTVYMYGGTFSITGSLTAPGVTFGMLGGTLSIYNSGPRVNITAPTGTSVAPESYGTSPAMVSQNYQDVLFALWGGAFNLYQTNAPAATMSGLIYNPQGNVSIYHDQTIVYPATNGCFQVIANVLDIYENAKVQMAPCKSFKDADKVAGGGAGTLIQ